MKKWMSGAVVVLAMMSVSWTLGRPAASAATQPVVQSDDPLASDAAIRFRNCQSNHWRSFALQPRF